MSGTSPERIQELLKQSSPIRKKYALEAIHPLQPVMPIVAEEDSPNKRPHQYNEEGADEGSMAASQIAHVNYKC